MRTLAKDDESKIHAIAAYLKAQYGIPAKQVKVDRFYLFDRITFQIQGPFTSLTEAQARKIIHCIDVSVLNRGGKLALIIELDGSIHNFHSVQRKDNKRNTHYQQARNHASHKLDYIIINEADCKELGITWFEYLDSQIKKLGVFQNDTIL